MELNMIMNIIMLILGTVVVISVITRFLEQLDFNRVNAIILAIILYVITIVFAILAAIYPMVYFIVILLCIFLWLRCEE